jgi:hypothetical protein
MIVWKWMGAVERAREESSPLAAHHGEELADGLNLDSARSAVRNFCWGEMLRTLVDRRCISSTRKKQGESACLRRAMM